ncbi:MAG: VOC family protein [Oligoflexales bacterium]|nr:VOC family protein [Oligoflexales bacterium]
MQDQILEKQADYIDPAQLCQIELQVPDIHKALDFYWRAFGWKKSPSELFPYHILDVSSTCPYGIALIENPNMTLKDANKRLILFFRVENLTQCSERIIEHGGRIVREKQFIPGYGTTNVAEDPCGHRWGFFEAKKAEVFKP